MLLIGLEEDTTKKRLLEETHGYLTDEINEVICEICGKFFSMDKIEVHKKSHAKTHKCPYCPYSTNRRCCRRVDLTIIKKKNCLGTTRRTTRKTTR
jgi:hypothetical protein